VRRALKTGNCMSLGRDAGYTPSIHGIFSLEDHRVFSVTENILHIGQSERVPIMNKCFLVCSLSERGSGIADWKRVPEAPPLLNAGCQLSQAAGSWCGEVHVVGIGLTAASNCLSARVCQ